MTTSLVLMTALLSLQTSPMTCRVIDLMIQPVL
jgi:hypothetical protein